MEPVKTSFYFPRNQLVESENLEDISLILELLSIPLHAKGAIAQKVEDFLVNLVNEPFDIYCPKWTRVDITDHFIENAHNNDDDDELFV